MTDSLQGLHASPLLGSPLSAIPAGSDGYGPSSQAAGEVLQVREWGEGGLYATTMFDGLGQFGGSLRSSLVLDQVSWLQMTATKRLP